MSDSTQQPETAENPSASIKKLSATAQRALKEAEDRRKSQAADSEKVPREIGGRGGEDPARFGDWEIKGRAIDF
ncbi:MAG: DUF1674 domain-containing protein [Phyllobacterium sp.]